MLFKPGLMKAGETVPSGPLPGPITSLAYITHTTATTETIVAPASINAGDLLVLVQRGRNATGTPTGVIPSGFTEVGTGPDGGTSHASISYKIADGTEDSGVFTGINGDANNSKFMWQYRANAAIVSLSVSTLISSGFLSGNPAAQTMTASGGTGIVLGITSFFTNNSAGNVDPRTTSITPDHEATDGGGAAYSHDYIQLSSPLDYTWDMDDEGNNNLLMGCYFHNMQT
jgi:hypothetical protein